MHKVSKLNNDLFINLLNENNLENNIEFNLKNNVELCLITGEILDNNFITLSCGHKFNYESLYNEIVYQKTRKLLDNSQLKINEIKCPYCRKITNKLLPFYKYYSIRSIRGVTYPEEYCMKIFECEYEKNGKKCNKIACKTNNGILCNKHLVITKLDEDILKNENISVFNFYKKKKIIELRKILSQNNCKKSGNKQELVNRIVINKNKIASDWIEN